MCTALHCTWDLLLETSVLATDQAGTFTDTTLLVQVWYVNMRIQGHWDGDYTHRHADMRYTLYHASLYNKAASSFRSAAECLFKVVGHN